MIKILNALLFFSLVLVANSEDVSFSSQTTHSIKDADSGKLDNVYTVQLLSTKTINQAKHKRELLPQSLKKDTHIYKVGEYIVLRYSQTSTAKELYSKIPEFKKYSFTDAYIVKSTKWHMRTGRLWNMTKKQDKTETQASSIEITNNTKISKYVKSNMLLKAQAAYKSGDESTAMLYYEMLLNSGYTTAHIRNNLCYLYGKRGAWDEAKKIIDKEKYVAKLLYAYAYGEIETNQDNFLERMSQEIMMDKSGRLALLTGHYFEQRQNMQRAALFYKMSYEKNPSDMYNVFAYARSLDIQKKYPAAIKQYKKLLTHVNKNHKNYAQVQQRVLELRR